MANLTATLKQLVKETMDTFDLSDVILSVVFIFCSMMDKQIVAFLIVLFSVMVRYVIGKFLFAKGKRSL